MPLTDFAWTPAGDYPATATALSTIATAHLPELSVSISNAAQSLETVTGFGEIASLSSVVRGAAASISIISAEQVLATATAPSVKVQATNAIIKATYNLKKLSGEMELYGYDLSRGGNGFFLGFFGIMLLYFFAMMFRSKYLWFNFCFMCGSAIEFVGFLARVLAAHDHSNVVFFALQGLRLTIAPAFIMAGISFLLAQNVAVYGNQYSLMRPMWYPYFFIGMYSVALTIQSIGGGLAPSIGPVENDSIIGIYLLFIGILIEVVVFAGVAFFSIQLPFRAFFQDRYFVSSDSTYKNLNGLTFIKMLLNVRSAQTYKTQKLDRFYNPRYQGIRLRPLFHFYPFVVALSTTLMFIRCVYRVVKLIQGRNGYIISHESFLFVFDSSFVALVEILFVPFHPVFVYGRENVLRMVDLDQNVDKGREIAHFSGTRTYEEHVLSPISQTKQRPKHPQTLYMA